MIRSVCKTVEWSPTGLQDMDILLLHCMKFFKYWETMYLGDKLSAPVKETIHLYLRHKAQNCWRQIRSTQKPALSSGCSICSMKAQKTKRNWEEERNPVQSFLLGDGETLAELISRHSWAPLCMHRTNPYVWGTKTKMKHWKLFWICDGQNNTLEGIFSPISNNLLDPVSPQEEENLPEPIWGS